MCRSHAAQPVNTWPPNDEAAGSRSSSATRGWLNAASWPSPKGASVRWGKVESPRLCCWGRVKWVRWEGTLLGAPPPPSIKGVMQLTRHDISLTEARRVLLSGHFSSCGPGRLSRALPLAGGDAGWNYAGWFSGNMTRFAVTWSGGAAVAESLGFFGLCGDNQQLLCEDPTSCKQTVTQRRFSPGKWFFFWNILQRHRDLMSWIHLQFLNKCLTDHQSICRGKAKWPL